MPFLTRFLLSQSHESVVVALSGSALLQRARAAGLPDIGLNLSQDFGLVPPADPRTLAKPLYAMSQKPERARSFGEAGRRRGEIHFTAERTGAATLRAYRDVCHQS